MNKRIIIMGLAAAATASIGWTDRKAPATTHGIEIAQATTKKDARGISEIRKDILEAKIRESGFGSRIRAASQAAIPAVEVKDKDYDYKPETMPVYVDKAIDWLGRVEISADRIDDRPTAFSGGMQQRLQIARNLVTGPRLVFMDEPTGGLDVSVQARLLDLLRGLVREMGLSAIIVTHDLAVVRLLADRLMVMKDGHVIESGLTDQVLDDPQHAYTQLLVSSVLQV